MRIDKTYSELWDLVNTHEDKNVIFAATMAITALQKLEKARDEAYEKGYQQGIFDERMVWVNQ